jgi:amino-acid N-acetyltransferase
VTAKLGGAAFRSATTIDAAAVRELVCNAGLPLDGLDDARVTVVATADERIVGVAALERYEDETGAAYLLRSVVVTPDARRHGIGEQLVATALALANGPVGLLTETAASFFAARGFAIVSRDDLPRALHASAELRGACPTAATAMLRR